MYVSQHDIASLDTNTLKLLVIAAYDQADDPRMGRLWAHFGAAMIRAKLERERLELYAAAEVELALDDTEGELLPDD